MDDLARQRSSVNQPRQGLTVIALADHDTVDGIAPALEAAKAFPRLKVIPGVEISTDVPEGEVHILGYFIDYTDHELLGYSGEDAQFPARDGLRE